MSAFQNIIDLRFAVSDHVGNRAISDVFPRLVELAEDDFNSRLRTRQQLVEATLFFEDGMSPLPPDFLEIYRGTHRQRYEVDGFNITMRCTAGDHTIQYYGKLPSLTCSPTATNWLLRDYPSVYLYGVALQAAKFLKDAELAIATSSLYGEAIKLLRIDDKRARYSDAVVRVGGLNP
ncbi:hypothetical protein GCM10007989_07380 [Devosia pacifica]|uniref:Uncharacterized protein n=1 Tax=Devosia pacifica TaxID=1335967 RepID=A0A918VQU8_9HYPH|nr:hypothetical protein [Devosia pacifica]GHA15147.1 hypothetical protein GCM10007989_07380 [Devosia pacifica]